MISEPDVILFVVYEFIVRLIEIVISFVNLCYH